jgi:hypothetical protein
MKILLAAILLFVAASPCAAEDASKISTEQLIDTLTTLDQNTPGIDDGGDYNAFLAEDKPPQFEMGLLPAKPPVIPPAMRKIVRRGASALSVLIEHLSDKRSTKIQVGLPDGRDDIGLGGQFYANEYDPRIGKPCVPYECQTDEDRKSWYIQIDCADNCPNFLGHYTVKVGDVCEVLIGQIVNRRLNAVRYQPTNILYVNSPIEQPSLVEWIKRDWGGVDATGLETALLDDVRKHPERFVNGALRRLRFYYPKTYDSLAGDDLKKREAFEAEEKSENIRR